MLKNKYVFRSIILNPLAFIPKKFGNFIEGNSIKARL